MAADAFPPGPPSNRLPPEIDTSKAHSARVWDYWLGGKDNYPADQVTGEQVREVLPDIVDAAIADRAFLGRAIRHLAGQVGIRQFLDIGTGLPTADNTHEVAQRIAPNSRVVYVDNDPLVLAHARALLTSTPVGKTAYIDADARKPEYIVKEAKKTLTFTAPIAISMLGILEHITNHDDAYNIVRYLLSTVPSGSHLVIADPVAGISDTLAESIRVWNQQSVNPIVARTREQFAVFFEGLELLEPGLVPCVQWRPDAVDQLEGEDYQNKVPWLMCGVGRKP
ncbi:SAM-dependent methyltransferase [Actinomadura sp. 9N215]|uniref:SAM-dependent methyltransferase n=1 Tax=Actinomadura sp. 9N215 TaxID=3375150 RepID=UPI0037A4C278